MTTVPTSDKPSRIGDAEEAFLDGLETLGNIKRGSLSSHAGPVIFTIFMDVNIRTFEMLTTTQLFQLCQQFIEKLFFCCRRCYISSCTNLRLDKWTIVLDLKQET